MTIFAVNYNGTSSGAGWSSLACVATNDITVQDSKLYIPPNFKYLVGIYSKGADITAVRLETPSFRKSFYPIFDKVIDTTIATLGTSGLLDGFTNLIGKEIEVTPTELIDVQVQQTAGGVADVMLILSDVKVAPDTVMTVPLQLSNSSGVTLVAGQPATVQMTPSAQLEAGTWACTGYRVYASNAFMARAVPVGVPYFTGNAVEISLGTRQIPAMSNGGMGRLFTFRHDQIPQLQITGVGATGAITMYMDIVKVA